MRKQNDNKRLAKSLTVDMKVKDETSWSEISSETKKCKTEEHIILN